MTHFSLLDQKKGNGKKKSTSLTTLTAETTEHVVSILSSLFTSLASDSQPRLRLLSKFVEDGYSKLDRLSELREELEIRLDKLETTSSIPIEMDQDERYLEKLENGGMALQFCDYVAAWVCMEDDGVSLISLSLLFSSFPCWFTPNNDLFFSFCRQGNITPCC